MAKCLHIIKERDIMSKIIALAALTTAVSSFSDEFSCAKVGNNSKNLKVTFADLKGAGADAPEGVSPDEHKYTKLIRLARHLRSQGIPASFSASFSTGEKDSKGRDIWVPYPAIYVNNEPRTNSERNEKLQGVEARMDRLETMFATALAKLSGGEVEPEVTTVEETEPVEAQPDF